VQELRLGRVGRDARRWSPVREHRWCTNRSRTRERGYVDDPEFTTHKRTRVTSAADVTSRSAAVESLPCPYRTEIPKVVGTAVADLFEPSVAVVAVVGLGYVGLPTALALVEAGFSVVGCDVSENRLIAIKTGQVDLSEADHARLRRHLGSEHLVLTTEPSASAAADLVLICVPTPVDKHRVPDLSALSAACASVVACAVVGQIIVLVSTTYVGCTRDLLATPLRERGLMVGRDVFVAFSPERIDPGNPAHDPARTPRVVGGVSPSCTRRASEILSRTYPLVQTVSSPEVAEMTKLLENTFRAVNIALANEFSGIARELGVDPIEVIHAAASKPFGFMTFYPGPGAGGHCIPCDPHYLLWQLKARRSGTPLIATAMEAIALRPRTVVSRAEQILAARARALAGARVLVLGVTYKPGVADVRESPAVVILDELAAAGAEVAYADPLITTLETVAGSLQSVIDPAARDWDLVIVHTLHPWLDHTWLERAYVLDATYQLPTMTGCHVP
jgi:UDP-N-acetyl-D-glucosamine dehydrogenase